MSRLLLDTLMSAPYVSRFGVRLEVKGTELTGVLPFDNDLVGNPLIPALHGGAVGAFLNTLEDVVEPFLLQSGFLARTRRGRMLTRAAADHLGVNAPAAAEADALFD